MTRRLIDNRTARRLFLARQGLASASRTRLTTKRLLTVVEELGFVQVDSINTVERAHHMILFARNQTYRPGQLTRLLERDRTLFENWTHDAAVIPVGFYPYWKPRFARERERLRQRWRRWRGDAFEAVLADTLDEVRRNGPLLSRELGAVGRKARGGWWNWHPEKTALEYLWRTGELAVARRNGFQKVYDLAERVIPAEHANAEASHEDFVDWACRSALARLGVATPGELAAFWGGLSPAEATAWCRDQSCRGLTEIRIAPTDGGRPRTAYVEPETLEALDQLPVPPRRLRVLSPFDPLIRDRARAERLFGFRYRIEVFVPQAKRRFGYYVFPLLEGERLVGRIDMVHLRQSDELRVRALWPEPGIAFGRQRTRALEAELDRLRRFVGAAYVTFDDGYRRAPEL